MSVSQEKVPQEKAIYELVSGFFGRIELMNDKSVRVVYRAGDRIKNLTPIQVQGFGDRIRLVSGVSKPIESISEITKSSGNRDDLPESLGGKSKRKQVDQTDNLTDEEVKARSEKYLYLTNRHANIVKAKLNKISDMNDLEIILSNEENQKNRPEVVKLINRRIDHVLAELDQTEDSYQQ